MASSHICEGREKNKGKRNANLNHVVREGNSNTAVHDATSWKHACLTWRRWKNTDLFYRLMSFGLGLVDQTSQLLVHQSHWLLPPVRAASWPVLPLCGPASEAHLSGQPWSPAGKPQGEFESSVCAETKDQILVLSQIIPLKRAMCQWSERQGSISTLI